MKIKKILFFPYYAYKGYQELPKTKKRFYLLTVKYSSIPLSYTFFELAWLGSVRCILCER